MDHLDNDVTALEIAVVRLHARNHELDAKLERVAERFLNATTALVERVDGLAEIARVADEELNDRLARIEQALIARGLASL